jgi:guanylate kinase
MAEKYKYILINDDIDETINNIKSIIEFERKNH